MPYMKERSAATYAKEILRNVSGSEIAENSVVLGATIPMNADGRRILETGTVMVYAGTSEVQSITITGAPTGGTFTLTFGGQTTAAIAYNATAADVQAKLEALSTIGAGNISVTGPNGGPFTATFIGTLQGADQALMTDTSSFTGGTTPDTTVAQVTAGSAVVSPTQKVKPAPASGVTQDQVAGIVMTTTEFWPGTVSVDKDDAAVALFTKNCHFASDQLTGYSGNAAAVKTAMTGGGNGRCANCNFSS